MKVEFSIFKDAMEATKVLDIRSNEVLKSALDILKQSPFFDWHKQAELINSKESYLEQAGDIVDKAFEGSPKETDIAKTLYDKAWKTLLDSMFAKHYPWQRKIVIKCF